MVTFDKGSRVPRLAPGVHLDARQVGILLSRAKPTSEDSDEGYTVHYEPGASETPTRLAAMVAAKGADHPQVSLLALGMGVLTTFTVTEHATGRRYRLEGTRAAGYDVEPA